SGIPLRALDVMAAGGFLISTYQRELAEAFEDGKELVLVHTPKELKECCSYYLAHEAERDRIRRRGQDKVLAIYDYKNIFGKMIHESLAENRERM
ncbi:MAG: glycosyltransferase family 1 protein, partial [Lachnospiraceae bacterium]|nr:glycosyltransferase family 1 protein [Lachnospiraceae bacterium]